MPSSARKSPMRSPLLAMAALSLILHGVAWASAVRTHRPQKVGRIEFDVVRRPRPEPLPSPVAPPPEPTPRRVRRVAALPAAVAPPPASPPSAAPRPLPRVGISLGSTVSTGAFAVGVGNTTMGRPAEAAADPATVRPLPPGRPSAPPRPVDLPRIPYPAEARKAGVEGRVLLLLRIDAQGAVTSVRVVDAPALLASAAAEGARRFRFTPALVEGQPVETEIRFTYTFLLE